eukprot:CAMPEP_0206244462 /NCGR_PEP_ID=MMETSP0047_2-20121206/18172_1 /ASSEMBLY_ACC=CAM_ASM_000192 /TAXON_ID=195065 /ORGANISM="Chroomonas mesostigmatica_cf, Strain CCMP1168" /LENGTH=259 /DNA_ID=CAMNT_0053669687 /DNA_START=20 /DNA_END=796 /DNA_ORIENTATION=-
MPPPEPPNPYKVLGLEFGATPAEIKKAHKKLALKWHPDKNKGDPTAETKFTEIQEAYEVLQDDKAREAFDNLMKAKKQKEAKHEEMNKQRRAEVSKLEEREAAAAQKSADVGSAQRRYQAELERLREASKNVLAQAAEKRKAEREQQQDAVLNKVNEAEASQRRQVEIQTELTRTVRVKWPKKGALHGPALEAMFAVFGGVESVVALKKSGMVVFTSDVAAANAAHAVKAGLVDAAREHGVTVDWVLPEKRVERIPTPE